MIILKFIILIVIFGASTSLGLLMSKKYRNRVLELREFKNAINILKMKIKFTYEPISDIFKEISKTAKPNISVIFKKASEYIGENTTNYAWNKSIEEVELFLCLNKEDINIIQNLGKMLGKTDIEGQISEIELVSSFIDKQIIKAEEDRNKNEKMYRSLGTIVGTAIVIILI